jgi:hypothetical protein
LTTDASWEATDGSGETFVVTAETSRASRETTVLTEEAVRFAS